MKPCQPRETGNVLTVRYPHRLGRLALFLALALTGCGPSFAPANAPSRPCPEITEAEFQTALQSGAARGDATLRDSGMVDMRFGPGVSHCASYQSSLRPCRRPNDLVIRYDIEGEAVRYVRVPADSQYRFQLAARPTTCQIVNE